MRSRWPSEAQIQVAVVDWCLLQHHGAQDVIHIPNEGKRSVVTGVRLKKQGLRPGVADLLVPCARGGWIGAWVELKAHGKKPTADQAAFLARMAKLGHATAWFDNVNETIQWLDDYCAERYFRPNFVHYMAEARQG